MAPQIDDAAPGDGVHAQGPRLFQNGGAGTARVEPNLLGRLLGQFGQHLQEDVWLQVDADTVRPEGSTGLGTVGGAGSAPGLPWMASKTSWRWTGTSLGATIPSRTLSPRISTTVTVMSLLMTMLSFFFLDSTNIAAYPSWK